MEHVLVVEHVNTAIQRKNCISTAPRTRAHTFDPSSDFIVVVVAIAAEMAKYTPTLTQNGAMLILDGAHVFPRVVSIMRRLDSLSELQNKFYLMHCCNIVMIIIHLLFTVNNFDRFDRVKN